MRNGHARHEEGSQENLHIARGIKEKRKGSRKNKTDSQKKPPKEKKSSRTLNHVMKKQSHHHQRRGKEPSHVKSP